MFTIDWKPGKNKHKSEIQQLSDRYIFTLCLYCTEIKKDFRNSIFLDYLEAYKNEDILQPTIAEYDPYKSILEKIESDDISPDLKSAMVKECEKYVNIHSDTKKYFFISILAGGTILFIHVLGTLFKVFSAKKTYPSSIFLLAAIIIVSMFFSFSYLFSRRKKTENPSYYLINSISDFRCLHTLKKLYEEIIKIKPITKTKNNQLNPMDETEKDFSEMKKPELAIELLKEYPKLKAKYPHFFYILQNKFFESGFKKRILIDKNYKIQKDYDRKMILCLIDEYKSGSNKLKIIDALFEPNYSNLSNEMTQDHPKKIKKLEKFLQKNEELYNYPKKDEK